MPYPENIKYFVGISKKREIAPDKITLEVKIRKQKNCTKVRWYILFAAENKIHLNLYKYYQAIAKKNRILNSYLFRGARYT